MYDVAIILGSKSDEKHLTGSDALDIFRATGVTFDAIALSAHRDLKNWRLAEYYRKREVEGTRVFIAAAGMSAGLPGTVAALVDGIVIGVPLGGSESIHLTSALFSMIDLPKGTAIGVSGLGQAGLFNAAILVCKILGLSNESVKSAIAEFIEKFNEEKGGNNHIASSDRKEKQS